MNGPDQRGDKRQPAASAFVNLPPAQEFVRQKKQRQRRADLEKNAAEMIARRLENKRGVIRQVSQALNRAVEIGRRRVDKKKMLERLGNELPAANQRIAQNQRGIVPDEIISQRRRVGRENRESEAER